MLSRATLIFPILLFLGLGRRVLANYESEECLSGCSDWSVALGYCRGQYGNFSQQMNLTYMNDFVGCLCVGDNADGGFGNDTMTQSAGICQSCATTPKLIATNLEDFLELCVVQSQNGTASEAINFRPQGYETSEDTSNSAVEGGECVRAGVSMKTLGLAAGLSVMVLGGLAV
ncbi:hypothetical protein L202_02782 [Cryptococcus amylolentus CBS 6039]|uniref:WSC domain-containing protein n=1 Tax=Cryptococcus amylolentus CBS 6039 TaxID=1295533 RepID=A0A1E3HWB0_9TREE|nr:hypothetical protein L202_02782 [Cryptococcus amylolentus CBS 6039]ODN80590.1 hypothetical protein L202_02782 [Cryptococcus amylolentus CBS 6039]